MYTSIQRQFDNYLKTTKFDEYVKESDTQFEAVFEKVSCASSDLKSMKTYSEMFNNKMKSKIEMADLTKEIEAVKAFFPSFCTYEHIKNINAKIDPFIETVQGTVDQFTADHADIKQIVRRFDEVLWEKASKFNLDELKTELQNYTHQKQFSEYQEQQNNVYKSTYKDIEKTNENIENVKTALEGNMKEVINRAFVDVK